jgi:RNA polymerase sigma-70 factor (ECF subfamily)
MRRVADSVDICQSVLGNFFARAALGQFDLNEPAQLVRLLVTMARNRVTDLVRQQHADRRDLRRESPLDAYCRTGAEPVSTAPSPSRIIAGKELLEQVRDRLSADERAIADRRADGSDWSQIAQQVGGTPEALRKRLARALDRVAAELGL